MVIFHGLHQMLWYFFTMLTAPRNRFHPRRADSPAKKRIGNYNKNNNIQKNQHAVRADPAPAILPTYPLVIVVNRMSLIIPIV